MAETIDLANDSVLVTSPADTDRVAIMRGSSPKTVTLADLAKAVRQSIRFSARNLLLGSNVLKNKPSYNFGSYVYAQPLVNGDTYALSAKVTLGSAGRVGFYQDGGWSPIGEFRGTQGETMVVTKVFTCKISEAHPATELALFQGRNGEAGTGASVEWATLVKGEIPLLDWVPAPEDLQNSGG